MIAVVSEVGSVRGGGRAPLELAVALARYGPVTFFARAVDTDARDRLTAAGVAVRTGGARDLVRFLRLKRPSAVSVHARAGLLVAARLTHPHVVATYHGTQTHVVSERTFPSNSPAVRLLDAAADTAVFLQQWLLWRLPHRTVAISDAAGRELALRYQRRATVIPWGAYPSGWQRPEVRSPAGEPPTLLSVSRFTPYKGFHHLLAVHRNLRPEFPNLRLVLAGAAVSPRYLTYLRQTAGTGVSFAPDPGDTLLAAAYRQATLYLSFDRFPFFGMTLLEAQAHGLPVIGLRRLATPELVRPGVTGYLVGSVEEAVERCRELLRDPSQRSRFADAARTWASQFTWEQAGAAYRKVLAK